MSLSELAIEILNEAKIASDAKDKLYKLEQVKEIVFHRDTAILSSLLPEVLAFMMEKSTAVRRFLLKFIAEACSKDPAHFDHLIQLCHFLIQDDHSQDGLCRHLANILTRSYGTLMIWISKLVKGTSDPRELFNNFQFICQRVLDLLASTHSDVSRGQYLRFAEEMILFALPPPAVSMDPRVARTVRRANAVDIPLHHPFVSSKQLEQDAEVLFNKLLIWLNKGGPQGYAFPPNLQAQLLSSVVSIGSQRPSKLPNAAKAILLFMRDRESVFHLMDSETKEHALRSLERILPAVQTTPLLSDLLPKLKSGVDGLAALLCESSKEGTLLKKRSLSSDSAVSGQHESLIEDEELANEELAASARAAVQVAESERRQQRVSSVPASVLAAAHEVLLCADLLVLPPAAVKTALVKVTFQQQGIKAEARVQPVQQPAQVHEELAMASLRRTLESCISGAPSGSEARRSLHNMCVRLVLFMSYADLEAGRPLVKVKLFNAAPTGLYTADKLPMALDFPRWQNHRALITN